MINACIYNKDGKLEGCITQTTIQSFYDSFGSIVKKAKELQVFDKVLPILSIMDKMLSKSNKNYTADYLNCLKLISQKHRYQLPLELSQIISRNYHDLLKQCCSNIVRDEVFNETINLLRDNDIIYCGKDIQGVEIDECAFIYNNITVGIKIAEKSDLYSLWCNKEQEYQAVVYAGNSKYFITENSFEVLILAIKACVEDYKLEDEVLNVEFILDDFAKSLIEMAKEIYPQGEYNGFI